MIPYLRALDTAWNVLYMTDGLRRTLLINLMGTALLLEF